MDAEVERLGKKALAHALSANVRAEVWLRNVVQGKYKDWRRTEWGVALTALDDARTITRRRPTPIAPGPTPPVPARDDRALYVVFCAQEASLALQAPPHYKIALSADPAYRDDNAAALPKLRAQGRTVAGWCDCRSDGTPAAVGVSYVHGMGLDYFIGQGESAAEFDDARSQGAQVIVGNLTALRGEQTNVIAGGEVAWIQEDYWCEGWARYPESPLITAYCAGIYPTALWHDPHATVAVYRGAGRWRDGDGLYHAAGGVDWNSLP